MSHRLRSARFRWESVLTVWGPTRSARHDEDSEHEREATPRIAHAELRRKGGRQIAAHQNRADGRSSRDQVDDHHVSSSKPTGIRARS
jgi:hypothetical protein